MNKYEKHLTKKGFDHREFYFRKDDFRSYTPDLLHTLKESVFYVRQKAYEAFINLLQKHINNGQHSS